MTGCGGICESSVMATMGEDAFTPSCTCCKPVKVKKHVAKMTCSDGKAPYEVGNLFLFFLCHT